MEVSELKKWILKRFESLKMTDEERRMLWGLPNGVKLREFARFIPYNTWREKLTLGENVYIGEGVIIDCNEEIEIGEGTHIGAYTQIWTHSCALKVTKGKGVIRAPVKIGKHTWIGGLCTIYPGVTIGDHVCVLPNSVVNRDLPSDTVWGGVPVREVKIKKV